MIHTDKVFQVVDVATIEALTTDLTEHTWTRCTGFRLQGLLFLNDSFSEDGAQEYAIVRDGRQVESITFSWQSRAEVYSTIAWLIGGGGDDYGAVKVTLEEPDAHHCGLCA